MTSGARAASLLGPVYAFTTLSWASYALVTVALPFRFEALGLGVVQYGTVVAVLALGLLATEAAWGVLAHRVASRVWILSLGSMVALTFLGVGFSDSTPSFALSLGLLGALAIFPVPLMRWLAVTVGGPGTGGSGIARFSVFTGAGLISGSALGPVLYVAVGFFWLSVAATGLWVLATAVLVVMPWARLDAPPRRGSALLQVRSVFTRHFGTVCALVMLYFLCASLTSNFLQYYSVRPFGGTPAESGYVIGAARTTSLVCGLLLGRAVDRWGPSRSAPFGFLLLVAGSVGTLASQTYPEMVLATLVFGVGGGWLNVSLLPLSLATVPSELQGTAIGVFGSFEDLGQIEGPFLIGGAYAAIGVSAIFVVVAGVAALGAVAAAALGRST